MFLYEKTHRYLKNDYNFFDALRTKDRKIRGNCNSLIKVKFHELESSSPLKLKQFWSEHYRHSLVPPSPPLQCCIFVLGMCSLQIKLEEGERSLSIDSMARIVEWLMSLTSQLVYL